LSKIDPIAATEKLLDTIRAGDRPPAASGDTPQPAAPAASSAASWNLPFRRTLTIGVDIGYNELRLAKANRVAGGRHELVSWRRVPFEQGVSRDDPQFSRFLRSTLDSFCGSVKNADLWSAISTARVEMRCLRIPKVSDKHLAQTVLWSFKKEAAFDEKHSILNFEVIGTVEEAGIRKLEVMAYSAPRQEIKDLRELFSRCGYPLTGISVYPFALQNLLRSRWLGGDRAATCSLYIGRNWSRIDLFTAEGHLALSRGIKAGMNSMVEAIRDEFGPQPRAPLPELASLQDFVQADPAEAYPAVTVEDAKQMLWALTHGAATIPVAGGQTALASDDLFRMLLPALNRLVRQVQRTLEFFELNQGRAGVERLFISGEIIHYRPVVDFLEAQLHLPVKIIDPVAHNTREAHAESSSRNTDFVPAVGLALASQALTPNLLFTYQNREEQASVRWINRIVFAVFLLLLAAATGYDSYLGRQLAGRQTELTRLQQQETDGVIIDENLIAQYVGHLQAQQRRLGSHSRRYHALAMVQELISLTPVEVRLAAVRCEGSRPGDRAGDTRFNLVIEGIVAGEARTAELVLANYLVALKRSPLLGQPTIRSKNADLLAGRAVLRFSAQLEAG
jgi:Tfp pilus assembly PilM family ATPase